MKILFVSHEADRSGAPILLLAFLRWLKKNTKTEFDVLLLKDGPLRGEFEKLGKTFAVYEVGGRASPLGRVANRALKLNAVFWENRAVEVLMRDGYDLIYGNTIVSLPWLRKFQGAGAVRCICHVHEMTWAIEQMSAPFYVRDNLPKMSRIIVCSEAVKTDLLEQFGVDGHQIEVAYSFIESELTIKEERPAVRQRLEVADSTWLIGCVGSPELRKGTDLIVQLAVQLEALYPDLRFKIVWLGGNGRDANGLVCICRHDARRSGVEDRILFVGHTAFPDDFINAFDCLVVPSREEPLSLVALAAAWLRKPVAGFANSGGLSELLRDDCGYLVPYLDMRALAEAVIDIREDGEKAERRTSRARNKVLQRFTGNTVPAQIFDLLSKVDSATFKPFSTAADAAA